MSDTVAPVSTAPGSESPRRRWKVVGPGLIAAATGVGAGDLVATLVAGSRFGYTLLWAAVLGCVLKIVLVEGTGRWTLSTGSTIFEGWRSLGRWTMWYFGPYIVLWGFVYGAAAMSSTALPLAALFPAVPLNVFAVGAGLVGLVLVWGGRYQVLEKLMAVFIGLMVVTVIAAAVATVPNLGQLLAGLAPVVPSGGGLFYTLGLAGGVGGTITLAAYGYWIREKGWADASWMRVMRLDNAVAYVVTGVFVIAMLVVGAELLYSASIVLGEGDASLVDLADLLAQRYGPVMGPVFLVGFFAASFSSLLGVWNGVSLMFADMVAGVRGRAAGRGAGGRAYRAYALWLTLPPMLLLLLGRPYALIVAYGVLGALFMPFLAITLLLLLNSSRVPARWRNGWVRNVLMGLCTLIFVVLGVQSLVGVLVG